VMSKISLKQLHAPCIFYNLNNYYKGMKELMSHMIEMVHNKFFPVFMRFFRGLKHYETLN